MPGCNAPPHPPATSSALLPQLLVLPLPPEGTHKVSRTQLCLSLSNAVFGERFGSVSIVSSKPAGQLMSLFALQACAVGLCTVKRMRPFPTEAAACFWEVVLESICVALLGEEGQREMEEEESVTQGMNAA